MSCFLATTKKSPNGAVSTPNFRRHYRGSGNPEIIFTLIFPAFYDKITV